MKILYFTDTQLTAKTPSGRLDSFPVAMYRKFYELGQVIKAENIDIVVHGGDFFNTPRISLKYAGEIAKLMNSWGVPIYVVPGNHDLYGYSIDTIDQTMLGMYASAGVVRILTRDNPAVFYDQKLDLEVIIEGQEYYKDIDTGNPNDYDMTRNPSGNYSNSYSILVPHGMALEAPFHQGTAFTLLKDIAAYTRADIILGAHYHPGFKSQTINGVTFIGPGSLARMEATAHNVSTPPKYAILDLTNGFNHSVRDIKNATPGNQVFDLTKKGQQKQAQQLIANFKQSLQSNAALKNALTIDDMVDAIAKATGIDANITSLALNYVHNAQIGDDDSVPEVQGFIEKVGRLFITKVYIKNFQSHKDSVVDFTDGLNAIIGESNQGKTAILRAIYWALYNEPSGDSFIRTGENSCSVEVLFSDGSRIIRTRDRNSAGTYEVVDPQMNAKVFKGFHNNIPVEVANTHQMPKVHLSKDLEVSLNVATQLEPAFLIGTTGGNRAAAVGRLIGVEAVDSAIKSVSKVIKAGQKSVKTIEADIEANQKELEKYKDLDSVKRTIDLMELHMDVATGIEFQIKDLTSIDDELSNAKAELAKETQLLNMLPNYEPYMPTIEYCLEEVNKMHQLKALCDMYVNVSNKAYQGGVVLSWIPKESDYDYVIKEADKLLNDIKLATEFREERIVIYREIQEQEALISNVNTEEMDKLINESNDIYNELKEAIELEDELSKLQQEIYDAEDKHSKLTVQEKKNQVAVGKAEKELSEYMASLGVCPTCGSELNEEHISHIVKGGNSNG